MVPRLTEILMGEGTRPHMALPLDMTRMPTAMVTEPPPVTISLPMQELTETLRRMQHTGQGPQLMIPTERLPPRRTIRTALLLPIPGPKLVVSSSLLRRSSDRMHGDTLG